jgi:hypothetical protein
LFGHQGEQKQSEDLERTDAMVAEVLCNVVTYHVFQEENEGVSNADNKNIPDEEEPTTSTFFPSYSLAFV